MKISEIDAKYEPFPGFSDWAVDDVSSTEWGEFIAKQEQLRGTDNEKLNKALKIVRRAAAVETGAIEELYQTGRGFTISVANEMATWEAALAEKGEQESNLIRDQLAAYEMVLDFATGSRPIAESWIRELHVSLCGSQKTYQVETPSGSQSQQLEHGKYKEHSNHVIQQDDSIHAYAPVEMTIPEMSRLIEELRSEEFQRAHPIIQAAYAHYCLVCIHPFADGNGRVARAMASVFTYRAASFPILITTENKNEYFRALALADKGIYAPFNTFIADRAVDAIRIVSASLGVAELVPLDDIANEISGFYSTKSGFTYQQIDMAGINLLEEFEKVLKERFSELSINDIRPKWSRGGSDEFKPVDDLHRKPNNQIGAAMLRFVLSTQEPADTAVDVRVNVDVPKNGVDSETIVLSARISNMGIALDGFEANLQELIPNITTNIYMLLTIYVETILTKVLHALRDRADQSLRDKGYR